MILPIIPIIIGAVAGIGVEKGLSSLFPKQSGSIGTKKSGIANVFHEPYESYAPQVTYAQQYQYPDYNIIVDSPFARAGSTKKQEASPELEGGISQGTNMTSLALIGVAGLVIYGVVSKK